MSDMLKRLRAAASDAGRDVAADLSAPASVDEMNVLVRGGIRRRRTRIGVVAGTACVAAIAAVTLGPALFDEDLVPDVGPAGPNIVHSEGALTVFDDGSMELVLSSGDLLAVPVTDEEPRRVIQRTSTELCEAAPDGFGPLGWQLADDSYSGSLLSFGRAYFLDSATPPGHITSGGQELFDHVEFRFQADPAAAEFLTMQVSTVHVWHEGQVPILYGSVVDGRPAYEIEGSGANRIAAVVSRDLKAAAYCGRARPAGIETGDAIDMYVVADIWLNDGAGNAVKVASHLTVVVGAWEWEK